MSLWIVANNKVLKNPLALKTIDFSSSQSLFSARVKKGHVTPRPLYRHIYSTVLKDSITGHTGPLPFLVRCFNQTSQGTKPLGPTITKTITIGIVLTVVGVQNTVIHKTLYTITIIVRWCRKSALMYVA